ncbi:MAG: hypothetical protein KatS3mg059_1413 [Thermomicrobiales bacterium]|nr:MAG: hypothetical protein KatS3mg059_1413 [Thermomicrobiales bacterium]
MPAGHEIRILARAAGRYSCACSLLSQRHQAGIGWGRSAAVNALAIHGVVPGPHVVLGAIWENVHGAPV